jgi:hypothetical protein
MVEEIDVAVTSSSDAHFRTSLLWWRRSWSLKTSWLSRRSIKHEQNDEQSILELPFIQSINGTVRRLRWLLLGLSAHIRMTFSLCRPLLYVDYFSKFDTPDIRIVSSSDCTIAQIGNTTAQIRISNTSSTVQIGNTTVELWYDQINFWVKVEK